MKTSLKGEALPLEWLSDEFVSPLADKLWRAVLEEAAKNGQIRMSKEVIKGTLISSPSDCLYSRKIRKDLITALISLIPVLRGGPKEIVRSILDFHNDSMKNNSGICRLGKYHDVLYIAVYIIANYQVKDLILVSLLLSSIFHCENGFDRIIGPAVLGCKVSHILSSWKPDSESSEDALATMKYFNYYSNLGRLSFECEKKLTKKRFLDFPMSFLQNTPPLTVAVLANDVKSVETLLHQGVEMELHGLHCPYKVVTQKLSDFARITLDLNQTCYCSGNMKSSNEVLEVDISRESPSNQEWTEVLCSSSFLQIPSSIMCRCKIERKIQWPNDTVKILNLISSCMTRKIFKGHEHSHPKLVTDELIDFNPFPLKHFARAVIRERLYQNWQLPHGVRGLGLPFALQNYLSLQIQ